MSGIQKEDKARDEARFKRFLKHSNLSKVKGSYETEAKMTRWANNVAREIKFKKRTKEESNKFIQDYIKRNFPGNG